MVSQKHLWRNSDDPAFIARLPGFKPQLAYSPAVWLWKDYWPLWALVCSFVKWWENSTYHLEVLWKVHMWETLEQGQYRAGCGHQWCPSKQRELHSALATSNDKQGAQEPKHILYVSVCFSPAVCAALDSAVSTLHTHICPQLDLEQEESLVPPHAAESSSDWTDVWSYLPGARLEHTRARAPSPHAIFSKNNPH